MSERPWLNEPDRLEFESHGFPCLIRRTPLGHLCGYVAVPPNHKCHGKPYYDMDNDTCPTNDLRVHGGLTYAGYCQRDICHIPQPGEPDNVWWFGFDAAHCFDLSPQIFEYWQPGGIFYDVERKFGDTGETYKGIDYMKAECESLAEQLKAVA